MNKIVCERVAYTKNGDIHYSMEQAYWRDIITHEQIKVKELLSKGYVITDVQTSSASACSQSAGTVVVFDHTILTLQKEL